MKNVLEILRKGTQVIVRVNSNLDVEYPIYPCSFECDSENYAELVVKQMRHNVHTMLENIRQASYNRAWKEKASKKYPKSKYFARCFFLPDYEKKHLHD